MVPRCSHCLHSIPYIQQRGLLPISAVDQRVPADPPACTLALIVTYTRQVLLTVAYTIHAVIYSDTHIHTLTRYTQTISSGAYMLYLGLDSINLVVIFFCK